MKVKEIIIGFFVGVIANVLGIGLYISAFSKISIKETLKTALEQGFLGSLIALGAILNLVAFFLFLKQNKTFRARGVLLATVVAAVAIALSKL